MEEFKNIGKTANINELTKKFSGVDKSVIEVAEKVKRGKAEISDLDEAMNNAATTGAKFATSLKNIATNMIAMFAINFGIKLVSAIWDAVNVTVAEVEENIDGLTSSLNELNREYDELNSRDYDSLSQSEKDRLQYLDDRIKKEERLLEIEQAKKYNEEFGRGFTDFFDSDNYWAQYVDSMWPKGLKTIVDWFSGSDSDNPNTVLANAVNLLGKYKDANNNLDETNALLEDIDKGLIKEEDVYNNLGVSLDNYKQLQEGNKALFEGIIKDSTNEMQDYITALKAILLADEAVVEEAERAISNPNTSSNTREKATATKKTMKIE